MAGASGLIGRRLVEFLESTNRPVRRLVRRPAGRRDEFFWNPATGELDPAVLAGVGSVINLCGENVAGGRWSAARRQRILRSRVDATRTLVAAIRSVPTKPDVLVNASAIGFYGDRADEELDEGSAIGQGFLPEVCLAWETHAEGVARTGVRTVLMRFGVVLTPEGGALAKLLPIFRFGLGGKQGGGAQWMSWIAVDDAVGAIYHAMTNDNCSGPINAVAPEPVRNSDFARVLANVLGRPALLTVPAPVLRLVFGRMADETLLSSARVMPQRLLATGYAFAQPQLEQALRHLLGRLPEGKV